MCTSQVRLFLPSRTGLLPSSKVLATVTPFCSYTLPCILPYHIHDQYVILINALLAILLLGNIYMYMAKYLRLYICS